MPSISVITLFNFNRMKATFLEAAECNNFSPFAKADEYTGEVTAYVVKGEILDLVLPNALPNSFKAYLIWIRYITKK